MPTVKTIQQRFSYGEIDPLAIARSDIEQYYSGAEKMRNVLPLLQGGYTARPGLKYIDRCLGELTRLAPSSVAAPEGGTAANAWDEDGGTSVTTTTDLGTVSPYVVASGSFAASQSDIALLRIRGARITAGTADGFRLQYSADNSTWIDAGEAFTLTGTAQELGRRVFADARYFRLARVGGVTDAGTAKVTLQEMSIWRESAAVSETKLFPYAFSEDEQYAVLFSDKNIAVYKNDALQNDIRADDYTAGRLAALRYDSSGNTTVLCHEDVAPAELLRVSDSQWQLSALQFDYIPLHRFTPAVSSPAANITPTEKEGSIEINATAAVFTAAHEGQLISGNGGDARIVSYVSDTKVKAIVEIPFYDKNAILSGEWELLEGYEDAWSDSRGWPICSVFHEGRLYFGGSKSLINVLWGSHVGGYLDFDPGTVLADEAFTLPLGGDQYNRINALYSGQSLMIFTAGGEYIMRQTLGEPITPESGVKRQTANGSAINLLPFETDGAVMFIQRGGKSVREFVFDDTRQAFASNIVTLLSAHLLNNPQDFALRQATGTDDANYVLIVNADGSLTIGTLLRTQNVAAFTPQETEGRFKNCAAVGEDMAFIVERDTGGVTRRYLERFDKNRYTDASVRFTDGLPANSFDVPAHLEGETCKVLADNANLQDRVPAGGTVTIERNAKQYCEIGLDFTPFVRDMPVEVSNQQISTARANRKRITQAAIEMHETRNVTVNGKKIIFRGFGPAGNGSPLDAPPPAYTGVKIIKGFTGFDRKAQLEISRDQPGPFTILSVSKTVNITKQ